MIEIEKVVLIIIFIIVLVVCIYILVEIVLPNGSNINIQTKIRQCCNAYRAYGEGGFCPNNPSIITNCPDDSNLNDLMIQAGMTVNQLKAFCGCSV